MICYLNTLAMSTPATPLTEDFLQFVWEQRLYPDGPMETVTGEPVAVIDPGMRNPDAGPDFFNARVRIGETLWAGNIEIHRNSSDWQRHRHHQDGAYDNVILHVVGNYDLPVARTGGESIPALVLPFPAHVFGNFKKLMEAKDWIPCQATLHRADRQLLKIGFNRLLIERLEEKSGEIGSRLEQNRQDWNEAFYQFLARSFGFKTNALPFELLARSLPLKLLARHSGDLFQVEALLFGQAGFLHDALLGDDYYLRLRTEYDFLSKKYHLKPMAAYLWKFLRLRPVNFPTLRIAQFAALVSRTPGLFSRITEAAGTSELLQLTDVTASEYWTSHYKFNYPSSPVVKHLGNAASESLIINAVIPFLFVYGRISGRQYLRERALEWLDSLPPETNSVISRWNSLGVESVSAFETQALLHLKNRYCDHRRCLHCPAGSLLVKKLS